jgi:hypothetical protein
MIFLLYFAYSCIKTFSKMFQVAYMLITSLHSNNLSCSSLVSDFFPHFMVSLGINEEVDIASNHGSDKCTWTLLIELHHIFKSNNYAGLLRKIFFL